MEDRAWNTIGLAIRFAYGNALHLHSEAPSLRNWKGELRIRLWYSLCYLESILCMSTGRPPGISPRYFSTPVPHDFAYDIDTPDELYDRISPDPYATASLELFGITAGMFRKLYSAKSTLNRSPINESHAHIQNLLFSLDAWKNDLPSALTFEQEVHPDDPLHFQKLDLALRFHHIRMLTTRACLCKFEPHLSRSHQPEITAFDNEAAQICCTSASAIAQIILDLVRANGNTAPFVSGPWWCIYPHITSAAAVLLLEMAYGTVHVPDQSEELFVTARDIIAWLCSLAISNPLNVAAQRCCEELSQVLAHVAPKVGRSYTPPSEPMSLLGRPTTPGGMDIALNSMDIPSMIENPQLLEFYFPLAPQ